MGYHSNFNFECNTGRGSIESLSIALGLVVKDRACLHDVLKRHVSKDVDGHKRVTYIT